MTADAHIVENAHLPEQLDILEGSRQPALRNNMRGATRYVHAIQHNGTGADAVNAGKEVKDRCLARTIRTNKAIDCPLFHRQGEPVDCRQAAELLTDFIHF